MLEHVSVESKVHVNWFTLHRVANRSVLFRVLTTARCTPFVKKEDLKVTESLSKNWGAIHRVPEEHLSSPCKGTTGTGLGHLKTLYTLNGLQSSLESLQTMQLELRCVFVIAIYCYIVIRIVVIDQLFSFLVACRLAHPTSWQLKYWTQNTNAKENIEQCELVWWSFVSCPFPSIETIRNHLLHIVPESQGMLKTLEIYKNWAHLLLSHESDDRIRPSWQLKNFPCIFRPFLLLTMKLSQAWNDSDQSQPFCIAWAQIEIGASRL